MEGEREGLEGRSSSLSTGCEVCAALSDVKESLPLSAGFILIIVEEEGMEGKLEPIMKA